MTQITGTKPGRENFTDKELRQFEENELSPYLDENRGLSLDAELNYLQSNGVIKVYTSKDTMKTMTDGTVEVQREKAQDYATLTNKISQWKLWRDNDQGNDGWEQQMEELAEMASSIG